MQIFDTIAGASSLSIDTKFNYEILVYSVSPTSGGLGGGYNITITGKNFASPSSMNAFIGNAMNSICIIVSGTST